MVRFRRGRSAGKEGSSRAEQDSGGASYLHGNNVYYSSIVPEDVSTYYKHSQALCLQWSWVNFDIKLKLERLLEQTKKVKDLSFHVRTVYHMHYPIH